MATDAEIAWAAGLFEGEGCFHITKTPYGGKVPVLSIQMTDRDVLEKFQRIVDSGRVSGPNVRPHPRKPIYKIDVAERASVKRVTAAFLPWLGERRKARALEILALVEKLDAAAEYRAKFCKRGHAWTPENIYTSPRGIRACRQCKKEHGREWMRRKRASDPQFHEQEKAKGREYQRQKRAGAKLAGSLQGTGSGS